MPITVVGLRGLTPDLGGPHKCAHLMIITSWLRPQNFPFFMGIFKEQETILVGVTWWGLKLDILYVWYERQVQILCPTGCPQNVTPHCGAHMMMIWTVYPTRKNKKKRGRKKWKRKWEEFSGALMGFEGGGDRGQPWDFKCPKGTPQLGALYIFKCTQKNNLVSTNKKFLLAK